MPGHPQPPENSAKPCAVPWTSAAVITVECVEKLIRKDVVDPVNEDKLTDCNKIML